MAFEDIRNDFEVRYRFLSPEEGGRKITTFYQGYRSDWSYDGHNIDKDGIFMIWPIFINENGVAFEKDVLVPNEGIARMFIVNAELRKTLHKTRIKVGAKGFFMEGPNRVAEATVIRVVGLAEDF